MISRYSKSEKDMIVVTVLLFGLLSFTLSAATASAAEKLRVAYPTLGPGSTPSWVTHETGFWKKSGLDVELVLLSGGARMLPALISGSVDMILGSDTGVTLANLQGANLVRIGVTMNSLGYSLVTQPAIRSIQDLKGKVLGTGRGRLADRQRHHRCQHRRRKITASD
jgi:NitT/TauT family transport system substrate-binding protein